MKMTNPTEWAELGIDPDNQCATRPVATCSGHDDAVDIPAAGESCALHEKFGDDLSAGVAISVCGKTDRQVKAAFAAIKQAVEMAFAEIRQARR